MQCHNRATSYFKIFTSKKYQRDVNYYEPFCGTQAWSDHRIRAACGHNDAYLQSHNIGRTQRSSNVHYSAPLTQLSADIPWANKESLPFLYCVTLCKVCFLHLAAGQCVLRVFGMFTYKHNNPKQPSSPWFQPEIQETKNTHHDAGCRPTKRTPSNSNRHFTEDSRTRMLGIHADKKWR